MTSAPPRFGSASFRRPRSIRRIFLEVGMLESIHQNLEDMRLKTIVENICQKGALKHLDSPSSSSHNAHPLNNPMGLQKTKCLSHPLLTCSPWPCPGYQARGGVFLGTSGLQPIESVATQPGMCGGDPSVGAGERS